MEQMGEFLVELLSSTAAGAAGVGGTALGGPLAGAAAATATAKVTSSLVRAFLGVEDAQLNYLEALNRDLGGRLAELQAGLFRVEGAVKEVRADLRIQLDEPWKTARLYLEQAAEAQLEKASRDDYLIHARDKLFEAYSVARDDVRRALVAQRLAGSSTLVGDGPADRLQTRPDLHHRQGPGKVVHAV